MGKLLNSVFFEPLGQGGQLSVRQTGIGFADIQQFIVFNRAANGKGVV